MATLFFEVSFESEVTEDSHAGGKKRRHQESGAMAAEECYSKKRRLCTNDLGRKSEELDLQDDAVSGITTAGSEYEYEYDPSSTSSESGEEIGGCAASCCSSNMPNCCFSPGKRPVISYESDLESCGSNSPEEECGFDAWDFAEQLLMFKDEDDDDGDYLLD